MKEGFEGTNVDSAEKQAALREYQIAREGLKTFINQSAVGPLIRMSIMNTTTLVQQAYDEVKELHTALEGHPDNAVFNAAFGLVQALRKKAGLSEAPLQEVLEDTSQH